MEDDADVSNGADSTGAAESANGAGAAKDSGNAGCAGSENVAGGASTPNGENHAIAAEGMMALGREDYMTALAIANPSAAAPSVVA